MPLRLGGDTVSFENAFKFLVAALRSTSSRCLSLTKINDNGRSRGGESW